MILNKLKGQLIVSCQALENEPLHSSFIMGKMAKAAKEGGAKGIRANSIDDIVEIKKNVDLPIIGIIKKDYPNSSVFITPTLNEVKELIDSPCEIIATDCTLRKRPKQSIEEIVQYCRENSDKLLMADCSTIEDVKLALKLNFDIISSTLVGYTEDSKGHKIEVDDFSILKQMLELVHTNNKTFFAEGNINTPEKFKKVLDFGSDSVVVGSSITRPQLITKTYVDQIK